MPTAGTLLIISAGKQAWLNRVVLSSSVLVWFGLISFPLYLWHWPLLSFARIVESETPSREIRIAVVLISIVLAWLTYWLIEKPVRFGKHNKVKTIMLLGLMMFVGYVGYNSFKRDGLSFRDPTKSQRYLSQGVEQQFKEKCTQHFDRISHCAEIVKHNDAIVLMIGDSHIRHTFEIIKNQVTEAGYDLIAFSNGGCPFLLDVNMKNVNDCALKNQEAMEFINTNKEKIKFIVVTAQYSGYMDPDWLIGIDGKNVKFSDSLYKTIYNLQDFQVIFIEQVPPIPFDPKKCISRPFKINKNNFDCQISEQEMNESLNKSRSQIYETIKTFNNVNLFNLDSTLCRNKICTTIVNNELLYYDKTHLNPIGVEFVQSQIKFNEFLLKINSKISKQVQQSNAE